MRNIMLEDFNLKYFYTSTLNFVIMKKAIILTIAIMLNSFFGISQTTTLFDYVSPFNEGFSAEKKVNQ